MLAQHSAYVNVLKGVRRPRRVRNPVEDDVLASLFRSENARAARHTCVDLLRLRVEEDVVRRQVDNADEISTGG